MAVKADAVDLVVHNARVLTCADDALTTIDAGHVAIKGGLIVSLGTGAPPAAKLAINAGRSLLTPGLIDCHTHLVYAGDRAHEFERRLQGASYADIARAGGGIAATVRATRAAGDDALLGAAGIRAGRLLAQGVTTVEIKSGYGLDVANESKQLRVARALALQSGIEVATTCLAAHAVPPEFTGRSDAYIDFVSDEILPAVARAGLADAVDAFCDHIAFSLRQTRRVFDAARALGLPVKLHAEQLSDQGGAQLAAEFNALSCDHLEHVSAAGVAAMARAGTVAVLLPGAFYFLRETRVPPISLLREMRVPMAIATDCNPGSSPTTSLLLMLNMACTLFLLTPAEAVLGVTRNAARALGRAHSHGTLAVGKVADLALWAVENVAQLCYPIDAAPPILVVKRGEIIRSSL